MPAASPTPSTSPRGDIQGLRAVAVLTVVASHAGLAGFGLDFGGGYVGVDVFFVISGFLITGILVREVQRTGRVSIVDFYARRARRILPAASIVLVAITIASWLAFGYVRVAEVLREVVWASLFGANVHFALDNSDYFAADDFTSPVQHYWSLAVEEQFYLVWPLLVLLAALVASSWNRRLLPILVVALAAGCALSLAWSVHRTEVAPTFAYFSTFTRAWELGLGALLALAGTRVRRLPAALLQPLGVVGLVLIAVAVTTYDERTSFPGVAAAVPVLGSVLVLAAGMGTGTGARWWLDRAPLRWVGDRSYSLYLWHWPFLTIPAMSLGRDLRPVETALLVLGAVVASDVSYRFVETPFRSGERWRSTRSSISLWPIALGAVAASVAVVAVSLPADESAPTARFDPQQASQQIDMLRAVEHAASRAKERSPLPERLTPAPLELGDEHWDLPHRCWANAGETRHTACAFGDLDAKRTLVLYGDSHMGVWVDPVAKAAAARHWRVVLFLKTGCPPYELMMWHRDTARVFTECEEFRGWAQQQVANLQPDRIVITGSVLLALTDPDEPRRLEDDKGAAGRALMEQGMRATIADLTAITPKLDVIADTNKLLVSPLDCLGGRRADLGTCATGQHRELEVRNRMWAQVARAAGGRFVDTSRWLCADEVCPLVVGNVIVYADDDHLTRTYAAALRPLIDEALFGR